MAKNNGNGADISKIWLASAQDIAAAIGRDRHDIPRLVTDEGLPAFKFYGKWTCLWQDMEVWSRHMAKKYRGLKKHETQKIRNTRRPEHI